MSPGLTALACFQWTDFDHPLCGPSSASHQPHGVSVVLPSCTSTPQRWRSNVRNVPFVTKLLSRRPCSWREERLGNSTGGGAVGRRDGWTERLLAAGCWWVTLCVDRVFMLLQTGTGHDCTFVRVVAAHTHTHTRTHTHTHTHSTNHHHHQPPTNHQPTTNKQTQQHSNTTTQQHNTDTPHLPTHTPHTPSSD